MGVRGYVLDTKFGPQNDVTKTSSSYQNSTGRVAAMIPPPREHTSCCSHVISASASIVLHRARMPRILEHPVWFVVVGTYRRSEILAAQPRTAWALADFCVFGSLCRKRTLFLVGNVDSRDLHVRVLGHADVAVCSEEKHVHPKASTSRSEFCSSRDHTRLSVCLSRLPWFLP